MRSPEELDLIAAIADGLTAGIWVAAAADGRFVYANAAFDEIMGMGPEPDASAGQYAQAYGIFTRNGELYPEDELPFARALRSHDTVYADDIVIHRRDGSRVFVRTSARPMRNDAGVVTHVAVAFFDISREVLAEVARAKAEADRAATLMREIEARRRADETEERLRRVVGNAPIVVFAMDAKGYFELMEGRGLQRLGWGPGELNGQSVFEVFADMPVVVNNCRKALEGHTTGYVVDFNGVVFDVRVAPIFDEGGKVSGAIGVATDITDQQRAETQLVESERLASVGMLAAGVAHEVNNPLAYVIGNLELVVRTISRLQETAPSEALMGALNLVRDARQGAERVRTIVRDLKVFSRSDRRTPKAIDVRAPLDAALDMAKSEIKHRARLTRDIAPVPVVCADEGRLGQLFLNLLINAAQSISKGPVDENEIRVTTGVNSEGWIRVEIKDTGAGIAKEVLKQIFDPFFTTKPPEMGTGLGLSICRGIANDLGGRIEVSSERGFGTTFRVLLPPAPKESVASTVPPAMLKKPNATAPSKRGTVLVVDDEPFILKVVESLLSNEHEVTCESRGTMAVKRIEGGERYDAILCDLMMPDMSGVTLYERVKVLSPAQADAILFVTGGAFTDSTRSFLERVPNATLEKPFDSATLMASVRKLIR